MQHRYCDQGRSRPLLTTTWPIFFLPQLLWNRGEAHQRIDLLLGKQPRRLTNRMGYEVDLPFRIDTHIGRHAGNEAMVRRSQGRNAYRLALEVAN